MLNLRYPPLHAQEVIDALKLSPHPEGGYYREVWRDMPPGGGRAFAGRGARQYLAGSGMHARLEPSTTLAYY